MIINGYYYPVNIWKHKLHRDSGGAYIGDSVFNFAIGNRQAGKSVGVGIFSLLDYFNYGYKSVIFSRYMKDFEDGKAPVLESFWKRAWNVVLQYGFDEKLKEYFPALPSIASHKLEFNGHIAYIDDEPFSWPVALNLFNKTKTSAGSFDNVHTIIYDEFVSEDGRSPLNNEVEAIYNSYDSIARGRDDALKTTSMVFISNIITYANPLFMELGIDKIIREDTKQLSRPEKGFYLEMVNNKGATEKMNESVFARAIKDGEVGKRYLGYSQGRETKDNKEFITNNRPPKGRGVYFVNINYNGMTISVKDYQEEHLYYLSDTNIEHSAYIREYAMSCDDHTVNTILLHGAANPFFVMLKKNFDVGNLRFNSQRTKNTFLEIAKYLV